MYKTTKLKDTPTTSKVHVKKNDEVLVISGKDRGKRGKVLRVIPTKSAAVVERVNFIKKHTRANPQRNIKGGILEREAPIKLSNLQVICPSCSEPARLGRKATEKGSVRVCRKCKTEFSN
ncbi:MAG: 50S ribosomal protein L24 [Thermoanaerobaculia bacterium]|nr:50S ribosomal protein L24 [Thermoanaerobaculia bacterium]